MKKVLITLDYDPSAQKVAETGFSLAKAMKAEVILLHVLSEAAYYSSIDYSPFMGVNTFSDSTVIPLKTLEGLRTAANTYLNKSKQHLGDNTIQTIVREGDFADSIIEASEEFKVDIIVMGTHGRRGLDKILMGSVTEKVLRHSSIPLFIIPTREPVPKK